MYRTSMGGNTRRRSRSRTRSREKRRRDGSRSSSEGRVRNVSRQDDRGKRHHFDKTKPRRVRFVRDEQLTDIKIFRKEDEPNAKPLTDADLYDYQQRLKSENRSATYFTPEELKHKESLMEGDAMKKYKERQKTFNDKLMLAKEEIAYYTPPFIKATPLLEGENSTEKEAHSSRINTTLGCFYSRVSEIPDEPAMNAILNDIASEAPAKIIAFERTSREEVQEISKFAKAEQKERARPLKGILKRSLMELSRIRQREIEEKYRREHEQVKIDPNFLRIINDISVNKGVYSMEKVEELLKPYKQNGVLEQYMKRLAASKEAAKNNPAPGSSMPMAGGYGMTAMVKPPLLTMLPVRSDKYKTVPCKYFHGPLGCQKKDDCTFIHDETCAGFPTRNMHRYVKGMEVPPPYYYPPKPGMPLARPNNPNLPYPPPDPTTGVPLNINLNSLNNNGGVPLTNMNRPQHLSSSSSGGPLPAIGGMIGYSATAYPYPNYNYGAGSNSVGSAPPGPFMNPPMGGLPPPPTSTQQNQFRDQQSYSGYTKQ